MHLLYTVSVQSLKMFVHFDAGWCLGIFMTFKVFRLIFFKAPVSVIWTKSIEVHSTKMCLVIPSAVNLPSAVLHNF